MTYKDCLDENGQEIISKKAEWLRQVLAEEYGIETEEQLDQALEELEKEWDEIFYPSKEVS
ncbi:hypothetical protein C7959_12026 [Orenia marismortui]|uniref:Uncharacterized protein n=2 Tax=Orenia marismortui TaxID=46469 RepID=A0A4V3GXR1_9FIRM|nr:hypothetical protein C7959_12026 [Orenia marismortui]